MKFEHGTKSAANNVSTICTPKGVAVKDTRYTTPTTIFTPKRIAIKDTCYTTPTSICTPKRVAMKDISYTPPIGETMGHKHVGPIRKGQGKYISDGRVCSKIVAPSER